MSTARPHGPLAGRVASVSLGLFLTACASAGDASLAVQSQALAPSPAMAAADAEAGASAPPAPDAQGFAALAPDPAAGPVPNVRPVADAPLPQPASASAPGGGAEPAPKPSGGPRALAQATPPGLINADKRATLGALFSDPAAGGAAPKPLFPQKTPLGSPGGAGARPLIQLASAPAGDSRAALDDDNDLPGVRQTMLFEIKRKSGVDDESDVDVHEEDDVGPVRVATAAGLARLAPNGLLRQTETVDTACLKPALVRNLKKAEAYFGKRLVLTSGYRSPAYNRKVRGAERSMHMFCAAADIQMPGVSKWELARYFRAQPERGGVGTYCSTESIHVDIGPERDWNWKCGRRG